MGPKMVVACPAGSVARVASPRAPLRFESRPFPKTSGCLLLFLFALFQQPLVSTGGSFCLVYATRNEQKCSLSSLGKRACQSALQASPQKPPLKLLVKLKIIYS